MARGSDSPTVENRRAKFQYFIEEKFEAGLVLEGSEVKAIRTGKASLADSLVRIRRGQAYLVGCHIGPYVNAGPFNHEARRDRKLLLHKREIERLGGRVREKGYTLVVTRLYFKEGRVKAEVALARGKKAHDKRSVIRERQVKKEMERAIKSHR